MREDWLYYRVQVDVTDAGDHLLRSLVRPVTQRLRAEVPELRWFYLRFLDATGMHVRLRLNAGVLDHVERVVDGALSESSSYHKRVYEPEVEKYGADLRLSEDLFQLTSEMALELLAAPQEAKRIGYGAALMLEMISGLPHDSRAGFLHQYNWYWSGGPARRAWQGPAGDGRLRAQAAGVLAETRKVLAGSSGEILRRYVRRFWTTAGAARSRSDYFQLFHHLHLANNRIGVFPATEAALSRLLFLANMTDVMSAV